MGHYDEQYEEMFADRNKRAGIVAAQSEADTQRRLELKSGAAGIRKELPGYRYTGASSDPTSKPSNPKDLIGSDKLPYHLWPGTATALGCLGLLDGMLKYGRANWREAGVRYSIYLDAAMRHMFAAFEGEDTDPDSGLPHEAHALACLAIIVDARAAGKLVDDRAYAGGYRPFIEQLTAHVARLKAKHADKNPKHWTIADNKEK